MEIKRARGHRLYTVKGKKILDLSMDFGRAVIGHRPNGLSLTIKNVIDRGIYASYNSVFKDRLVKYILKSFPEYAHITILEHEDKALNLLNRDVKDPLFTDYSSEDLVYWRPFLKTPKAQSLILLYPLPGLNSLTILISKKDYKLKDDRVSPVLLAGVLRSFYDYDAALKVFKPELYETFKSVSQSKIFPPYMVLHRERKEYEKMCCRAENEGILLNSDKQLLILPNDYSLGEINKVLNILG